MVMQPKHCVVTDESIFTIDTEARKLCKTPLSSPVRHISDLWALGKRQGITHFWIMPETSVERMEWAFLEDRKDYTIFIPGDKREDSLPRAATCRKEWGSLEIVVNYPKRGNGFGWVIKHPLDILAAVDYLSSMLSIHDLKFSPMSIGKTYLKEKFSKTKRLQSYIRKPSTPLPKEPFKSAGKCEVFFTKQLDASMIGKTFHLYDKNSAHPAAASSMVTGYGDFTHLTENIIPKSDPGAYRVTCTYNPTIFNGVDLPPLIITEWVTLDLLKYAMRKGCTFNIHEAFVFKEHHNIFGDWARDLWQVRQMLKNDVIAFPHPGGRNNGYITIKEIMNFTVSSQEDNVNWWADMVGMARTARLANLEKFAEGGNTPILMYADDIGFTCDDSNYETAVPGIFIRNTKSGPVDNRNEMGGYKHEYSLLITEEMVQEAPTLKNSNSASDAKRMLAFFKKFAIERGLINE